MIALAASAFPSPGTQKFPAEVVCYQSTSSRSCYRSPMICVLVPEEGPAGLVRIFTGINCSKVYRHTDLRGLQSSITSIFSRDSARLGLPGFSLATTANESLAEGVSEAFWPVGLRFGATSTIGPSGPQKVQEKSCRRGSKRTASARGAGAAKVGVVSRLVNAQRLINGCSGAQS
jgi:hypothetical protein